MNIGQSIRTLPTVKPKLYAGKVGTIAARNEDEFGVLINGKIVWFVEREIEEWDGISSTTATNARGGRNANGQTPAIPTTTGVTNAGTVSSVTSAVGSGQTTTRADQPTREGGLGTQERAREGGYRGLCSMCGPVGANVCSSCRSCRHVCRGALGNPCAVMTNPPRAVPGSERPPEPRPPSAPPRGSGDLSGLNPGERGRGGGVVAKCVACGALWERPKQRGRPSLKCEECR